MLAGTLIKMVVEVSSIAIVSSYGIALVISLAACQIIRTYHESKPLGMQSFLTKVIVIFVNVFHIVSIYGPVMFSLRELFGPMDYKLAAALSVAEYLVGVMFYFTVLMVTTTKFLSIYHGTIIDEVNEEQMLPFLKRLVVIFPLILTPLEFSLWTNIEDTESFQFFFKEKPSVNSRLGYGMLILVFINFIAAILLQAHIEYNFYQQQSSGNNIGWIGKVTKWVLARSYGKDEEDSTVNGEGYKLSITRAIVALIFILAVCVTVLAIFKILTFQMTLLIFYVILADVCPLIFIYNHPNMRALGLKLLKSLFC